MTAQFILAITVTLQLVSGWLLWRISRIGGRFTHTPLFILALGLIAAHSGFILFRLHDSVEFGDRSLSIGWAELGTTAGLLLALLLLYRAAVDAQGHHEAMSRSEVQLRLLTDALPVAISYVDHDGRYRFSSAAVEDVFFLPRDEVQGKPLREMIPDDIFNGIEPHLRSVMEGNRVRFKINIPIRDCVPRTYDVQYVPDFAQNGFVRGFYILSSDITPYEEVRQGLQEVTDLYRTVLDSIHEGMTMTQGGRIVYANPAMHAMLGYQPGDLIGISPEKLAPAEIWPESQDRLARHVAGEPVPRECEMWLLKKGGEDRVLVEVRATRSHYEGAPAVLSVVLDVTDRWAHKRQQREVAERLRRMQSELAHAQQLSAVGETAATLAHELNQPLNAIVSYVEGALMRFQPEIRAHPALGEVLANSARLARRASQVVRSVRTLARKAEVAFEPLELSEVLKEVVRLLDAEAHTRNVEVQVELGSAPLKIAGDRVQIEQLLVNLMGNAMEAMETVAQGSRRLTIAAERATDKEIEIRIADNGPGINSEIRPQLFKPFLTTKAKGLGMGLAVCRYIVEHHGGRIWVGKSGETGTTFHIALPIAS